MQAEHIAKFLKVAIVGAAAHPSSPGVVYFDEHTQEVAYVLLADIPLVEFRNKLREMIEEDDDQHWFVVCKASCALHVAKVPRRA